MEYIDNEQNELRKYLSKYNNDEFFAIMNTLCKERELSLSR